MLCIFSGAKQPMASSKLKNAEKSSKIGNF